MTEIASAVITDLRRLAGELAQAAGGEILAVRAEVGDAGFDPDTKSSAVDLVTIGDQRAEALIVSGIVAERPDDAIRGEEGTNRPGTSNVRWVIDPIDGTTNYVYGYPGFVVSIGVEVDGEAAVGAVYDPLADHLWTAAIGQGATRNAEAISVTGASSLQHSLIATGFDYQADERRQQARALEQILPVVRDIRRSGSAAYDLCTVADGRVDAYYQRGLKHWDWAAGVVIAREAGAVVTDLHGGRPGAGMTLAVAPGIADELAELMRSLEPVRSSDQHDQSATSPVSGQDLAP